MFQITIDNTVFGTFNASTTADTSDTLLFFATHFDAGSQHQVEITNQVDGMMFALDYCVAVQDGPSQPASQPASVVSSAAVGPAVVPTAGVPTTSAVFPNSTPA